MFVNNLKLDVGLYLGASGASTEAIDTMHNMGVCVSARSVLNHKKKLLQVIHMKLPSILMPM